MSDTPFTVRVLCAGNSSRSIRGEGLVIHVGQDRVRAFSTESEPKGALYPGAQRLLARSGIDTAGFRLKSWDAFTGPGAPPCALFALDRAAMDKPALMNHLAEIGAMEGAA